jgi:hypothetical protein
MRKWVGYECIKRSFEMGGGGGSLFVSAGVGKLMAAAVIGGTVCLYLSVSKPHKHCRMLLRDDNLHHAHRGQRVGCLVTEARVVRPRSFWCDDGCFQLQPQHPLASRHTKQDADLIRQCVELAMLGQNARRLPLLCQPSLQKRRHWVRFKELESKGVNQM